eukprot:7532734-Pyramimonas_sp.AAC.1
MVEFRDGAPEVLKTLEAILDHPSFVFIAGCDEWDVYLSTIQSLARALPVPERRSPRAPLDKSEWLGAAQDALRLAQKHVAKLQGEA